MAGRSISLANLITRVRSRCDMTTSPITDASIIDWLNSSTYPEFYNEVLSALGDDYASTSKGYTTVASTDTYYLTDTGLVGGTAIEMLSILAVDLVVSSTDVRELAPCTLADRNQFVGDTGYPCQFRIVNNNRIVVAPAPSTAGWTLRVHYVPGPATISVGGSIDCFGGWEGFLIADLAAKCLLVEESDASALLAERERFRAVIRNAGRRQQQQGQTVRMVLAPWQTPTREQRP
jgi:hypothetical protein